MPYRTDKKQKTRDSAKTYDWFTVWNRFVDLINVQRKAMFSLIQTQRKICVKGLFSRRI